MSKPTAIQRMEVLLVHWIGRIERAGGAGVLTAERARTLFTLKEILTKLREFVAEEQMEEQPEDRGKLIAERLVEIRAPVEDQDGDSLPSFADQHGKLCTQSDNMVDLAAIEEGIALPISEIVGRLRGRRPIGVVRITYRIEEVE